MYVTSAARLRFDIAYYINKLRIVQNRRLHNNSWLTTLPLWCELNRLTCTTSSETRHIFKQGIHLHNDYLIFYLIICHSHWCLQNQYILPTNLKISLILPLLDFTEILPLHTTTIPSMDIADYWPMAREYSIWNATIASLQFWTEDLDPVTLGITT